MQAQPLEIHPVEDTPALAILAVRGRLDTVGARALAAAVEPRTAAPACRVVVLDLAGIAVRGRFDSDSTPATVAAVKALEMDSGVCSVFGDRGGYAPPAARP
ncbi:MAG: hypothetical protein ACO3G4_11710, partial [Opitutaceae bacterium]